MNIFYVCMKVRYQTGNHRK